MSGICGWINNVEAPAATTLLAAMVQGLGGNPPDPGSLFVSGGSGLSAWSPHGNASASIYKGKGKGKGEEDGLLVALEGHPHWHSDVLSTLSKAQNPATALATAYRRHGIKALEEIHGPFALVIIDQQKQQALLAIDRMGIRPLCYAHATTQSANLSVSQLVFGSTTDSVVAHPAVTPVIDPQAIFNYLFCHMVPSPGSIYAGVRKLLPGQYILFQDNRITEAFYWTLEYQEEAQETITALSSRFKGLLNTAVQRTLSAQKTGAFLSGGTDSSTVTGVLTEVCGTPAQTYSMGFQADGFDEIEYARITAKHFSSHTHEYYVTPQDVVDAIPLVAQAYDEPFGNASAVPTYYCAKLAHQDGIRVMLAGDGGDEIFGGNARYSKQKIFELYSCIPAALRQTLIEPVAFSFPEVGPFQKLQSYIRQARVPLPDRLESYNFLHRTPLGDVFESDFLKHINTEDPVEQMRDVYQRAHANSHINRMMYLDLKQTLADNDLRKVNRMCALAGVDVRYPLLDEDIVEFAARIPPQLQIKGVKLRYFFKEALRDFLPAETLTKAKHGFGLPFGMWMNTHAPLRDLAYDSLRSFRQRGYIKPAYLDQLIEQHRAGHASYYGVMIWVIMMLEQWLQAHKK